MTVRNWTLVIALGVSALGISGCVEGGERYDPDYRRPGVVVVERDRYDPDDRRRYDRYDRDYRASADGRDRFAERRDRFRDDRDFRGGDGRYDRPSRGIDETRRAEFCQRLPQAPICRGDRNAGYY